jgi:hypothetical protein
VTQWVTAYHCIADDHGNPYLDEEFYIDGKRALIVSGNYELDLATLRGPTTQGLIVSFKDPDLLSYIWTAGYPFEETVALLFAGVFSAYHPDGKAVFNLGVTYGMSGSPVMEKDGLVVGLVQQTGCRVPGAQFFCPVSRGATLRQLRLFLYGE